MPAPRSVPCVLGLCACFATYGCAGTGWIKAVPVKFTRLSPTESLDARYDADSCFHWIDAAGNLCVAVNVGGAPPPEGSARKSVSVSMILGPPPASSGRTYRVSRETMRMTERDGSSHGRCASLSGIVTAWYGTGGRLHVRFRLFAKLQQFHILMGWHGDSRLLMYGELVAVPDPARGERLLRRTELNGMQRTTGVVSPSNGKERPEGGEPGSSDAGDAGP